MSTVQSSKIQFLSAMNRYNGLFADLGQFLIEEKVATEREVKEILFKSVDFQAAEFYILMKRCEETMLMVDWEWKILPSEFMKLIIVTRNGVKEFVWAK